MPLTLADGFGGEDFGGVHMDCPSWLRVAQVTLKPSPIPLLHN